MKNKTRALVLSIFLGTWGVDRFYLGYTGMGVLKLLTGGGFGVLWILDMINIASGKLGPADGSGYSSADFDMSSDPAFENMSELEQKCIAIEKKRIKWRNIGLFILLYSIGLVLVACFCDGTALMAIIGAFGIVIGLIMFGSHLKPPEHYRDPKANSGTKNIIKGAVVGGIIAGEAGAVIGATIAKNNIDSQSRK